MRKQYIAGNWKMNMTIAESAKLAKDLAGALPSCRDVDVAVTPQFLSIPAVAEVLKDSPIGCGAQDVFWEKSGAFTGEISAAMLLDAGCSFALVGHSERRHVIGENDEIVLSKLNALLDAGLDAILCIGEKLEERESGEMESVLERQLRACLTGMSRERIAKVTVAYEPVWAIGTGKTATTEQAQEAHSFVRGVLANLFGTEMSDEIRIQYGGRVKPANAADLASQPDVDGLLVGGASLSAESFLGIVGAVRERV